MGVTISHSVLAPISVASIAIGFISFAFTLATFLKVFWNAILALYSAPSQITDYLSNLKQGLLEERRHLRRIKRRLKSSKQGSHNRGSSVRSRSTSHPNRHTPPPRTRSFGPPSPNTRYGRGRKHHESLFERDMQSFHSRGNDAALRSMRIALRDMIQEFRRLERPFLKPEFRGMRPDQWSNTPVAATGGVPSTYPTPFTNGYGDGKGGGGREDEEDEFHQSDRFGMEYRNCTLRERWLWLRRKDDVVRLSEGLSRIEVRRSAHEVGTVLMMVQDIGRDLEAVRDMVGDMEGRLSRVVGVRRVD